MVKHHFPILKAPCFSPGAQHAGHGTVRTAGSAGSGGPGSRGKAGKISCHGSYDISYGYDVYGKTWEHHGIFPLFHGIFHDFSSEVCNFGLETMKSEIFRMDFS